MSEALIPNLLLIVALIALNAFFAAAEIALVSARRTRLRQLADDGSTAARTALRLVEDPTRFLSTVQVGITIAGFFASAIGALSLVSALTGALGWLPPPLNSAAGALSLIIVTTLISFASIILGELVPKTIALQAADSIVLLVARPIALLARLAAPIVQLLTFSTNLLLRLTGSQRRIQYPTISQEELLAMVEAGKDEGVISPTEASMTEGVFGLGERRVRELMVPRVDVAALPLAATVGEARQLFLQRGHSRIPIFEGTLDNVVGVLHVKDMVTLSHADSDSLPVAPLIRPPLFVPEGQPAAILLRQLQRERRHLALVIDEHGGTAGIITLEDLLEEIVGEIADEYDPDAQEPLTVVAPDEIIVIGGLPIADLNDALDLELVEPGVDTVGGLITARLGRFARVGDLLELTDVRLEVLTVERTRIRRLRATRLTPRSGRDYDGA